MKERSLKSVPLLERGLRRLTYVTLSPVFPRNVYDTPYPFQEGTGIERMKELTGEGYGALFDITHFGYSDLPQSMATLQYSVNEMVSKRLLVGAGAHQIKPGVIPLTKATGVEVLRITTQDTIDDAKKKGKDTSRLVLNEGLGTFTHTAMDYLSNGHHVLLAGQGGRKPTLYPSNEDGDEEKKQKMPTTLGTFFLNASRHGVTRFTYMPIGMSIVGVNDYSKDKVGKYNLFKKYNVVRGLTFTYDEIMKAVNGDFRQIDSYLTRLKANLVFESYFNIFDEEKAA